MTERFDLALPDVEQVAALPPEALPAVALRLAVLQAGGGGGDGGRMSASANARHSAGYVRSRRTVALAWSAVGLAWTGARGAAIAAALAAERGDGMKKTKARRVTGTRAACRSAPWAAPPVTDARERLLALDDPRRPSRSCRETRSGDAV